MGKAIEFPTSRIMQQVGCPSPVARGYLYGIIPALLMWGGLIWGLSKLF